MKWYNDNPYGSKPTLAQEARFGAHKIGRQLFASNYARGGFAATAFAPTAKEAFLNPWRRKHDVGSLAHIKNLEHMYAMSHDQSILGEIEKAKRGPSKLRKGARLLGGAGRIGMAGFFIGLPFATTSGGIGEKGRAVGKGIAEQVGWEAGMMSGASIGGAIAGPPGAAIGAVIGGIGGMLGAGELYSGVLAVGDSFVDRERSKRNLNWVNDTSAFNTRKAATMRQQSLMAMNSGQMNARSMLGREAMMIHQ